MSSFQSFLALRPPKYSISGPRSHGRPFKTRSLTDNTRLFAESTTMVPPPCLPLHVHAHEILPKGMTMTVRSRIHLLDLCELAHDNVKNELAILGLDAAGARQNLEERGMDGVVMIRELGFCVPSKRFVSRFLPHMASACILSLKKQNLSLDDAESFDICDDQNRSQAVINTVNAAYFLQQRCSACGAEVESDKKSHVCAFVCIAACQMAESKEMKQVIAFVEYNLLATSRECATKIMPCISVHVITPSRLLSACYSIIDAFAVLVGYARGGLDGIVSDCPALLRRLPVDMMSLSTVVDFYMKTDLTAGLGDRQKTAMARILFVVGEHVLRTSVQKPMIVPFVSPSIETPDFDRYYVPTPMRQIVQVLQKTRIRWSTPGGQINSHTLPAPVSRDEEMQQFALFLSPFGVSRNDLDRVFRDWTRARALSLAGKVIQKKMLPLTLETSNATLAEFRYGVRCFFYVLQQLFFQEELEIADPMSLCSQEYAELELRFLLVLFRKGVSRKRIYFDANDVCDIIHPAAY